MNSVAVNILNNYKTIETICVQNHSIWGNIPEFRGAFSRFALKVAQLDLLTTDQNLTGILKNQFHSLEKLLKDIELILQQSFDRYFNYLQSRNNELYLMYSSVRTKAD
jgi:hypothetical protein